MDYTQEIIDKLELDASFEMKPAIRGCNGITTYTLIDSIIKTGTLEAAALSLKYKSKNPLKSCLAMYITPLLDRSPGFLDSGKLSWKCILLELIDYKYCTQCSRILSLSMFGKNIGKGTTGVRCECKSCHTFNSKEQKLSIRERTPSWADSDKIREFYNNCPEGMHVDHIVPLRGVLVSGLHVENNLQYLFAKDNMSKHNRFLID